MVKIIGWLLLLLAVVFLGFELFAVGARVRFLIHTHGEDFPFTSPPRWYEHALWLLAIGCMLAGVLAFIKGVKRSPARTRWLLTTSCVVVTFYLASMGPVSRWVLNPLARGVSPSAFDTYDQRLALYYSVYRPITWLRHFETSTLVSRVITLYESIWVPRHQPSPEGLVTDTIDWEPGVFWLLSEIEPKTALDAMPLIRGYGRPNWFTSPGAYAYYLPRSGRLVVRGTQTDVDEAWALVSERFGTPDFPVEMKNH